MTYNFFLVDRKDAADGTRIGYAYAIANKDKWIPVDSSSVRDYLTIGFVKGCDYIVHDGKAYGIMKSYTDIDEGMTIVVAVESIAGCDNKKVFNNLDRSSIIVKPEKKSEESEDSSDESGK